MNYNRRVTQVKPEGHNSCEYDTLMYTAGHLVQLSVLAHNTTTAVQLWRTNTTYSWAGNATPTWPIACNLAHVCMAACVVQNEPRPLNLGLVMVVPCQNKIILKNFSINIHEAVLQPTAAFVYCKCNRHAAAAAVAGRQTSWISARHAASRRLRN